MSELVLYGLKNCDTCKKAMAALEAAGHKFTFVDIRAEADLATKVPVWLATAGADALINKRSTTWRQLSDDAKAAAETDAASLLVANPTLIKRPVIERSNEVFVGWTKDVSGQLA